MAVHRPPPYNQPGGRKYVRKILIILRGIPTSQFKELDETTIIFHAWSQMRGIRWPYRQSFQTFSWWHALLDRFLCTPSMTQDSAVSDKIILLDIINKYKKKIQAYPPTYFTFFCWPNLSSHYIFLTENIIWWLPPRMQVLIETPGLSLYEPTLFWSLPSF